MVISLVQVSSCHTVLKEYHAVPLISITGCTGYYPSSMIRQYGMLQDITIKANLDRTTVDYLDPT